MDQTLSSFSGARISRVIDRGHGAVPEHAHDWPVLSVFVIGGYENTTELGQTFIAGPSAVLYRAGAAHANGAAASGFEQIEIEFDPAWLGLASLPVQPVTRWIGGWAGAASRGLARACVARAPEHVIRLATRRFIEEAGRQERTSRPAWVDRVERRLRDDRGLTVQALAGEVSRHPAWLGAAYRRATGEGPAEASMRFRVEQAARLLRETDEAAASVAAEAGFCDQSHMIRGFRRVLGRAPSAVRSERAYMRASA
ncbi:MAG: transcriptional regulator, AraC family [Caulobacter sp.]|nr:transcriptional regulator, AraC family [Caulobacter sp.]